MQRLWSRTTRIHRRLSDRFKGIKRLYQTEVSDGVRSAHGQGPTRAASEESAQRNWLAKYGPETVSELPAYTIATDFDEIEQLREPIDALRADNGRLLRLLLKRLSNDPRPEYRQLTAILANHP
jgi:hypothetical protein